MLCNLPTNLQQLQDREGNSTMHSTVMYSMLITRASRLIPSVSMVLKIEFSWYKQKTKTYTEGLWPGSHTSVIVHALEQTHTYSRRQSRMGTNAHKKYTYMRTHTRARAHTHTHTHTHTHIHTHTHTYTCARARILSLSHSLSLSLSLALSSLSRFFFFQNFYPMISLCKASY